MRNTISSSIGACGVLTLVLNSGAFAGPSLDSWSWSTIGDPGNRGTNDDENGIYFPATTSIGSVDYVYQMAVTEVTVGQYIEFAQDYALLYRQRTGAFSGSSGFTGSDFRLVGDGALVQVDGDVSLNQPIEVSWEYAARFVNWLHNGGGTDASVFDKGVYDTSTFTQNPDGSWNHTLGHNPNASVYMATLDEWTKAGYWDPDLNHGEGGYWRYNNSSDDAPEPFVDRNTGDPSVPGNEPLDVGMFPDVQSPWGIQDMAGGMSEWSESSLENLVPPFGGHDRASRFVLGTSFLDDGVPDPFFFNEDAFGYGTQRAINGRAGIRLVRPIPTPGSAAVLGLMLMGVATRRR